MRFGLKVHARASLYALGLMASAIGLVTFEMLVLYEEALASPWWWLPTALLGLVSLGHLIAIGRTMLARRSARWTWTRVETEEPHVVSASRMRVRVRVDAPVYLIHLKVVGPPALVLAICDSKQLWLIGELRSSGSMIAGIPEVPAAGWAQVVRRPK